MSPGVVWFNKSLSTVFTAVQSIRASCRSGETYHIICSHTQPDVAVATAADQFFVEPAGLVGTPYVDFCLEFAATNKVELLIPGKEVSTLANHVADFQSIGTRLLTPATAAVLKTIDDKGRLYELAAGGQVRIPEYHVVTNGDSFQAAVEELSGKHKVVCFKPAESIYGLGFHVIETELKFDRLLSGSHPPCVSMDYLNALTSSEAKFRRTLVMPYLEGPERSVDCLADHGRLIAGIVRLKQQHGQLLEDNQPLLNSVADLVKRLGLNGLFNVQFRDHAGETYLLEINARLSGGIHMACQSGVSLPYWAVRLAFRGDEGEMPVPRTGITVGEVMHGISLSNDTRSSVLSAAQP